MPRSSPTYARVFAIAALALVVGAVLFVVFGGPGKSPGPHSALDPYLAAWGRGDDRAAAQETDNLVELLPSTEERRRRDGQVRLVQRLQAGEVRIAELEEVLGRREILQPMIAEVS